MAIFDVLFEFSDAQSITTSAQSTDVLDWGSGMEDLEMGAGTPLWLNIKVGTAFSGGTNVTFSLYTHSSATSINSGTEIYSTPAFTTANLTANAWIIRMPLPVNCDDNRYFGLYYTVSGTYSAGTLDAWIDHGPQSSYDTQVATSNI